MRLGVNMVKLYQKSPLKNVQLGTVFQLLTILAVVGLEKFVLGDILFEIYAKISWLHTFGISLDNLITLLDKLVYYLFLFYWLNQYINENIRQTEKYNAIKSVCSALLLIMLNYSEVIVSVILPSISRNFKYLLSLSYALLIHIFVYSYVFYRALLLSRKEMLSYNQFIKKLFRFIKKKFQLILGYIGAYCAIFVLAMVVFFVLFMIGAENWTLVRTFPNVYIAGLMLQIITVIVPLTKAKLYTAFVEFFIEDTNP